MITAGNCDGRNGAYGYHFIAEILSANVRLGSLAAATSIYPDKSIIFYDDRGVMLAHTGDNREATARSLLSEQ